MATAYNVFSLCDFRAAGAAKRQSILQDRHAAFPPGKFPGTDYKRLSTGIANMAKHVRAGGVPKTCLALELDLLSASARRACRHVRKFEIRALRAERQLKNMQIKAKRP